MDECSAEGTERYRAVVCKDCYALAASLWARRRFVPFWADVATSLARSNIDGAHEVDQREQRDDAAHARRALPLRQ